MLAVTINAFESTDNALSTPLNSFVFGASNAKLSKTNIFCSNTLDDKADLIANRRIFLGIL